MLTNRRATRWMLRRIWRPSWTSARDLAELAGDEHEVGDRARHLRARALRDRQPRLLERRHVVDAVAEHADVLAALGQHPDDARLVLGRDAADRRRRRAPPRSSSSSPAGSAPPSSAAGLRRDAGVARDRADRGRVVAGQHLQRHLLGGEEGDGVGRRPGAGARRARRSRAAAGRRGSGASGAGSGSGAPARGERQHAAAAARPPRRRAAHAARRRRRRRAAPRARRARAARRPSSSALQRRREENGTVAAGASAATPRRRALAACTASSVELRDGALAA